MSEYDVLFTRYFKPRFETFGTFLTEILNLKNRLPVYKYRVSYETEPFVLREGQEDKNEEDVTIRQERVETGPIRIEVSDLIIPGDSAEYPNKIPGRLSGQIPVLGIPLTRDSNGFPNVLSTEQSPKIATSGYITGEVYREILVSVNDTVIGHFMIAKDFPDDTDPVFEKVAQWLRGTTPFVAIDEALSTLSIAKNLLSGETLKENIPHSRPGRLKLLEKLSGLEFASYPDPEDGGGFPKEVPFKLKIEALSKSYKETPNEIELREEEEKFISGITEAGKGAGLSQEELEKGLEEDYFATRREQLREFQEAGQTTYEEYMDKYQKKIEREYYEDLRDGLPDIVPYGQVNSLPTDREIRQQAQEASDFAIDQMRKRRLPGDEEREPDKKRLKAEARMALMETKGDVHAAVRLIRKWRGSTSF